MDVNEKYGINYTRTDTSCRNQAELNIIRSCCQKLLEQRSTSVQNAQIEAVMMKGEVTVVQPGEVILQIVPVDGDLIVEARVMPEDVGHIRIGQTAEVKVDRYDASKFGYIAAKIKQISPSAYLDEKMNPYYLARIELEKNHVGG